MKLVDHSNVRAHKGHNSPFRDYIRTDPDYTRCCQLVSRILPSWTKRKGACSFFSVATVTSIMVLQPADIEASQW